MFNQAIHLRQKGIVGKGPFAGYDIRVDARGNMIPRPLKGSTRRHVIHSIGDLILRCKWISGELFTHDAQSAIARVLYSDLCNYA